MPDPKMPGEEIEVAAVEIEPLVAASDFAPEPPEQRVSVDEAYEEFVNEFQDQRPLGPAGLFYPSDPPFTFDAFEQLVSPDLPNDGPGDDRTDRALVARAGDFADMDALQWLMDGIERPREPSRPSADEVRIDPSTGEEVGPSSLGFFDFEGSDIPPAIGAFAMEHRPTMKQLATGIGELPRQAVGGIRDAAQSILDIAGWIADQGGIDAIVKLPDVGDPKTMAGSAVRAITQFMKPWGSR